MKIREVEISLVENTNQVVLIDSETKQRIGVQARTEIISTEGGITEVVVTFMLPARKQLS